MTSTFLRGVCLRALAVAAGSHLVPAMAQTTIGNGQTVTTTQTISGTQTLTIENGGTLRPSGAGINWNGASTAAVVTNRGTVESTGGRAIDSSGGATAPRSLAILNEASGLIQSSANDALRINTNLTAGTLVIDNAGRIIANNTSVISGGGQAIDLRGLSAGTASVTVINRTGGLIEAKSDDALRPGQNNVIENFGTIYSSGTNTSSGSSDGIDAGGNTGITVTNRTGGTISGARHGITADTDITVVNEAGATIIGRNGSGVGSDGNGTVTNYGTIIGAYAGPGNIVTNTGAASINGDGDGVDIDFIGTVRNFGIIRGAGAGGVDSGGLPNGSEGIAMGGGLIENAKGALISGASRGILIDDGSGGSAYGAVTIRNAGTIEGLAGQAIGIVGTFANVLENSGRITGTGSDPAVQMGDGTDTVVNSGLIAAASASGVALDLGAGNDTLTVRGGSFVGAVRGGAGNDTLIFDPGAGATQVIDTAFTQFETTRFASGRSVLSGTIESTTSVQVEAGATLAGTGTVTTAVLTNAGTVAPGNSPGTLTIAGNYVQTASGTLEIAVGAAAASRLAISGTASLGGTLLVVPAGAATLNGTSRILTAAAVDGRFASVLPQTDLITVKALYGATFVDVTIATRIAAALGTTPNRASLGAAIDSLSGSGANGAVLAAVVTAGSAQAGSLLDRLSPQIHAEARRAASRQVFDVQAAIGDHAAAWRAGALPREASGWTLWGTVTGQFGNRSSDGNAVASSASSVGLVAGFSRHATPDTVLGLALAWGQTSLAMRSVAQTGRVETATATLYASHRAGAWFADASATFGWLTGRTSRDLRPIDASGPAMGSLGGHVGGASLSAGYRLAAAGWSVEPAIGLDYAGASVNDVVEGGTRAGGLIVRGSGFDSLRATVGARFATSLPIGAGAVNFDLRLRYARELSGTVPSVSAAFIGDPSTGFTTLGTAAGRDLFLVGAGIGYSPNSTTRLFLRYDGALGQREASHAIRGGASISW
ncbi:autotransporter outer membrane beta-barrel domain-containing protein [Phreatobacter sp. AB_2022a]|uniref:autotransporter outer membrane beta-barrel domain-containing protein n=1 Tax=Phreatobacter sp. AB_2022a TaxID=3003134 RepID=UPI002287038E|nr:autotransporter outer membrane beta-barrel domain-containing protein [Phreatobacter sp. AB_2022a]MCZ0737057.1 autotransporter domain-containing protein [Phreatobacter sp. AB_2022a]